MNRERWNEVRLLMEQALALDAAEREALLDARCSDDAELRAEVEDLLAVDARTDGRLDTPAVPAPVLPPPLPVGTRLGPWELVAEIASGGMGTVYRAARADAAFEKDIAIKVVKRGLDTEEVLRRFAFERRVLAGLEHPHIARLLDAGSTDDGRPWLAMELVDGRPIDTHCEAEDLDVRTRLQLFCKVCAAVEHAHRHLVVHRDLKPGNILVSVGGEPKLVDFGIAKVLDPAAPPGATPTLGTSQALTPEYASPEQIRGEPISTSTDVYSLGVVLYEVLTGRRPFRIAALSRAEAERVLLETTPDLPSAAVSDPARRAAFTGDVDTIVLKALHADAARRYGSAAELADDIERHLQDLPVLARPDSLAYVAQRFVARHRVAVSAAALLVLSLATGFGVSWYLYQETKTLAETLETERGRTQDRYEETLQLAASLQTERERTQERYQETLRLADSLEHERSVAQRRFDDVRELANTMLRDMSAALAPLAGATAARELLLATGLRYLERLGVDAGDDPQLRRDIAWSHLNIADMRGGLAEVNLGRTAEAADDVAVALDLAEELVAADVDDPESRLLLSAALVSQVEVSVALGRPVRQADLERALRVCPAPEELDAAAGRVRAHRARLHQVLADGAYSRGDHEAARQNYALAVGHLRECVVEQPDSDQRVLRLGTAMAWLASFEAWTARPDAAVRHAEEAVALLALLAEKNDGSLTILRGLVFACSQHGKVLVSLGRAQAAIAPLERALAISEPLIERNPDDVTSVRDTMVIHATLLQPYIIAQRVDDALSAGRSWTQYAQRLVDADPDSARSRRDLAQARSGLARALGASGSAEEALQMGQASLDVWRAIAEADSRDVFAQHNTVATAWDAAKACMILAHEAQDDAGRRTRFEQAAVLLTEAYDRMSALSRAGHLVSTDERFVNEIAKDLARCETELTGVQGTGP